jgi:hypothetical protein
LESGTGKSRSLSLALQLVVMDRPHFAYGGSQGIWPSVENTLRLKWFASLTLVAITQISAQCAGLES